MKLYTDTVSKFVKNTFVVIYSLFSCENVKRLSIVSCFVKIQNGFTFLLPSYRGCPGEEAVKRLFRLFCDACSLQVHGARTLRRSSSIQLHHDLRQVEEGVHGECRNVLISRNLVAWGSGTLTDVLIAKNCVPCSLITGRDVYRFADHFSSSDGAVGRVCVCVLVTFDLNEMTFDLDILRVGST